MDGRLALCSSSPGRASFAMTITSALIGGLLAIANRRVLVWGIAYSPLAVARARAGQRPPNNMINDYFDTIGGVDTEAYVRTKYAPHRHLLEPDLEGKA